MTDRKPIVCIAIPTYRRPLLLANLLDQVIGEVGGFEATIFVADNEVSEITRLVVESRQTQQIRIHYLPVEERGISRNRNALVEAAFNHCPRFEWLVMYDDDAMLRPGATQRLVDCGNAYGADLVGGPTIGKFPVGYSNVFVRNSVLGWRTRWPTGAIDRLQITQNLGIARSLFDKVGAPLFDDEFGFSGGEDYDLFRRASLAGTRQVWCDEAVIDELVVPDRLSTRSIFYRAYSSGMSIIMVDRRYDRPFTLWKGNAVGLLRCIGAALFYAATFRRAKAARNILNTVYHVGRIAWQLGYRTERYR